MNQEEILKKCKKNELIKRILKLEEELAVQKALSDGFRIKATMACSTQLLEHQIYKQEVENWTVGLIKTLLENEDNCKLITSKLEENINSIIDARVQDKLEAKLGWYQGNIRMIILYNGKQIEENWV